MKSIGIIKSAYYVIIPVLLVSGCSKDSEVIHDPLVSIYKQVIGEWEWVKTIRAFQQEITPATEEYSKTLNFKSNNVLEIFIDGILTETESYEITIRDNISTTEDLIYSFSIHIGNMSRANLKVDENQLVISEAHIDGPAEFYIKP